MPRPRPAPRAGGLTSAAALLPLAIGMAAMVLPPRVAAPPAAEPASEREAAEVAPVATAADAVPAVCSEVEDSEDCHSRFPAGCSSSGRYDAALAFLKDRIDLPAQPEGMLTNADFLQKEAALPRALGKNNHNSMLAPLASLGEGRVFATIGFLYAIKQEAKESCNCELDAPDSVDYHMYIGFDPARAKAFAAKTSKASLADEAASVIVEMTPEYRKLFHPEWEFASLEQFVGKQVKVSGQLLADNEHFIKGQDCALGKTATCFRATIWELHPVTGFQVCDNSACGP